METVSSHLSDSVALSHTQKNRELAFLGLKLYHFQPEVYSLFD